MSILQGDPLPNITTTQGQTTTAPGWYTDYLNNLATQGKTAAQNAQFAGATGLQNQAFQNVAQNVGNYQTPLTQAGGALTSALGQNVYNAGAPNIQTGAAMNPLTAAATNINAATAISPLAAASQYLNAAAVPTSASVRDFMNPYTQDVVNAIGTLGQQNIAQNVAPQAVAGLVGAGQFGSRQGAGALAQNLANAAQGITAQQAQALQQGYGQALTAAQNQAQLYGSLGQAAGGLSQQQAANLLAAGQLQGGLTQNAAANQIAAGQALGNLTQQQTANQLAGAATGQNLAGAIQNLGLGDVNALATLGAQQQQINQNQQLFPLQTLNTASGLLRGYSVPTSVASTYTGPIPGAYSSSPLAQIAGIGSLLGALNTTPAGGGKTPMQNILDLIDKIFNSTPEQLSGPTDNSQTSVPSGSITYNPGGGYTTSYGNVINPDTSGYSSLY